MMFSGQKEYTLCRVMQLPYVGNACALPAMLAILSENPEGNDLCPCLL